MFKKKCHHPPFPAKADHREYSMILSKHDEPGTATPSLVKISLQAIEKAFSINVDDLNNRLEKPPLYPSIYPGEHYKLLAAFVKVLQPKLVIEVGTATGLSALALKKELPSNGVLHTFDLFSWEKDPLTVLQKSDFSDSRLVQHVADLSQANTFASYRHLFEEATLIFIDVTHDGHLEKKLLENLQTISFRSTPYIIFDDIHVWTMLSFWREIALPKLDVTSFGHWSGTGIVEGTFPTPK